MNVHKPKMLEIYICILYYAFLHYSYKDFTWIPEEFNYLSSVKDERRTLIKNNGINLCISISILSRKIISSPDHKSLSLTFPVTYWKIIWLLSYDSWSFVLCWQVTLQNWSTDLTNYYYEISHYSLKNTLQCSMIWEPTDKLRVWQINLTRTATKEAL